ncbi:MAG: hypothetical protein LBL93_06220 [Ruminococcus sp.]|jgi:flotillin|nr:hypothetical protein [Ruminococcus sp.]
MFKNLFDSNFTTGDTLLLGGLILGLILIIALIWAILNLRMVVPPNIVHIVQKKNGTVSYGVGQNAGNVYYKWPDWMPIIGVVTRELPVSNFDLDLIGYEAYDQDRLPFSVDVKAFFRISDTNRAAARVMDVRELHGHLLGIVQGAVRTIMATSTLQDIMGERGIYGERFTKEVSESIAGWGVEVVKNLELMDIKDVQGSSVIDNIMKKKKSEIEKESRIAVAENMKLAQEKEIETKQAVDIRSAEAMQTVGQRQAATEREVGIAKQQAEQAIQEQAKITAEKQMDVNRVNAVRTAEISKEAAIVKAEQDRQTTIIGAEQDKQAAIILAEQDKQAIQIRTDANKYQTEVTAAAVLVAKQNEAEGIKTLGNGEASSIQAVGLAKADAEKQLQLAQVTAQTTLAKEIGENKEYQEYLITIEQIKASRDVGVKQAENIGKADIKIIANAGDTASAINSIGEIFTSKGGTGIGAALEGLKQSPVGEEILNKFLSDKKSPNNEEDKNITENTEKDKNITEDIGENKNEIKQ